MDIRIFILILILPHWNLIHSMSISSEISEGVTFLHKTFPVPPSMRAIIEMGVYYPISSVQGRNNPIIGIYTTENHINIKKQCTHVGYSQLGNKYLHPRIRLHESYPCLPEGNDTIHYKGDFKVQDFKPWNFSFSFGFHCNRRRNEKNLFHDYSSREQEPLVLNTSTSTCVAREYNL